MRYIILVLLNLPVVLLALVHIITQFKLGRISKGRMRHQVIIWFGILAILVSSFPLYNYMVGKAPLDSSELSMFDIVEITAIIFLFHVINYQRQHIERTERLVRDLHQEVSIKFADTNDSRTSKV